MDNQLEMYGYGHSAVQDSLGYTQEEEDNGYHHYHRYDHYDHDPEADVYGRGERERVGGHRHHRHESDRRVRDSDNRRKATARQGGARTDRGYYRSHQHHHRRGDTRDRDRDWSKHGRSRTHRDYNPPYARGRRGEDLDDSMDWGGDDQGDNAPSRVQSARPGRVTKAGYDRHHHRSSSSSSRSRELREGDGGRGRYPHHFSSPNTPTGRHHHRGDKRRRSHRHYGHPYHDYNDDDTPVDLQYSREHSSEPPMHTRRIGRVGRGGARDREDGSSEHSRYNPGRYSDASLLDSTPTDPIGVPPIPINSNHDMSLHSSTRFLGGNATTDLNMSSQTNLGDTGTNPQLKGESQLVYPDSGEEFSSVDGLEEEPDEDDNVKPPQQPAVKEEAGVELPAGSELQAHANPSKRSDRLASPFRKFRPESPAKSSSATAGGFIHNVETTFLPTEDSEEEQVLAGPVASALEKRMSEMVKRTEALARDSFGDEVDFGIDAYGVARDERLYTLREDSKREISQISQSQSQSFARHSHDNDRLVNSRNQTFAGTLGMSQDIDAVLDAAFDRSGLEDKMPSSDAVAVQPSSESTAKESVHHQPAKITENPISFGLTADPFDAVDLAATGTRGSHVSQSGENQQPPGTISRRKSSDTLERFSQVFSSGILPTNDDVGSSQASSQGLQQLQYLSAKDSDDRDGEAPANAEQELEEEEDGGFADGPEPKYDWAQTAKKHLSLQPDSHSQTDRSMAENRESCEEKDNRKGPELDHLDANVMSDFDADLTQTFVGFNFKEGQPLDSDFFVESGEESRKPVSARSSSQHHSVVNDSSMPSQAPISKPNLRIALPPQAAPVLRVKEGNRATQSFRDFPGKSMRSSVGTTARSIASGSRDYSARKNLVTPKVQVMPDEAEELRPSAKRTTRTSGALSPLKSTRATTANSRKDLITPKVQMMNTMGWGVDHKFFDEAMPDEEDHQLRRSSSQSKINSHAEPTASSSVHVAVPSPKKHSVHRSPATSPLRSPMSSPSKAQRPSKEENATWRRSQHTSSPFKGLRSPKAVSGNVGDVFGNTRYDGNFNGDSLDISSLGDYLEATGVDLDERQVSVARSSASHNPHHVSQQSSFRRNGESPRESRENRLKESREARERRSRERKERRPSYPPP